MGEGKSEGGGGKSVISGREGIGGDRERRRGGSGSEDIKGGERGGWGGRGGRER